MTQPWSVRLLHALQRLQVALPVAILAVAVLMLFTSAAHAAPGLANLESLKPAMECAAVASLDLSGATDGKVTIASATVVTTGPAPYCEVRGTIAPANTIVVRLPTQGWTQRYLQTGCGGECGSSNINYGQSASCEPVTNGTIASATTDMGHQGQGSPNGAWAANNPQAQIDFAYRGVHATAQVAKALIEKFYGKPARYAYFNGCSDGGREALMEAERYPDDFNGIAAGAPAANMVIQNTIHHGWNVLANRDASGNYILLASRIPLLHAAVLAACDKNDGVADGVIEDPRHCDFNPASIVCKADQDPATCLTAAEAATVQKLHDGARDAKGQYLEQKGSHAWGSELEWSLFLPKAQGTTVGSEMFVTSYARYLAYFNVADPNWQLSDLKFDVTAFWQTVATSSYQSATDPDLSRFAAHGGKLVLWHGWADQHISPMATINYYDAMRATLGVKAADAFARLYLFPGVAHCGGGDGPNKFDVLTPVMAWVESGAVPGKIVAASVTKEGATTRTRPVFPFPQVARWDGKGSTDDAASFTAFTPKPDKRDDEYKDWVGAKLYSHGYQTTCKAEDTRLVCESMALPFAQ